MKKGISTVTMIISIGSALAGVFGVWNSGLSIVIYDHNAQIAVGNQRYEDILRRLQNIEDNGVKIRWEDSKIEPMSRLPNNLIASTTP